MSTKANKISGASTAVSFRWTDKLKVDMAWFINKNYKQYKGMPKAAFLRRLRSALDLGTLKDLQMKNGHDQLIKKYMQIREKLNSSGFGVDLDIDQSLPDWVLKQCSYFNILDEVLATRPNVTPPVVMHSYTLDPSETEDVVAEWDSLLPDEDDALKESSEKENSEESEDLMQKEGNEGLLKTSTKCGTGNEKNISSNNYLKSFVQQSFTGLGVPPKTNQKNAMSSFSDVMCEKMKQLSEIETKKLDFDVKKFEYQQTADDKKKEIDIMKIEADKEMHRSTLENERHIQMAKIESEREQRAFELRKLELQIELEKAKTRSN